MKWSVCSLVGDQFYLTTTFLLQNYILIVSKIVVKFMYEVGIRDLKYDHAE